MPILPLRQMLGCAITCALLSVPACSPAPTEPLTPSVNDATTVIPGLLMASAAAWNNADLPGHIGLYTESATFMGGSGLIRGRGRVSESLARSFWRDGRPKQQLSFDSIEVRPLGDRHALATGHFVLTGGGEADRSGWYSLTWEKTATGWRIVHDHSS